MSPTGRIRIWIQYSGFRVLPCCHCWCCFFFLSLSLSLMDRYIFENWGWFQKLFFKISGRQNSASVKNLGSGVSWAWLLLPDPPYGNRVWLFATPFMLQFSDPFYKWRWCYNPHGVITWMESKNRSVWNIVNTV